MYLMVSVCFSYTGMRRAYEGHMNKQKSLETYFLLSSYWKMSLSTLTCLSN